MGGDWLISCNWACASRSSSALACCSRSSRFWASANSSGNRSPGQLSPGVDLLTVHLLCLAQQPRNFRTPVLLSFAELS